MMATITKTILLINGDPNLREAMADYLHYFGGWNILTTRDPLNALASASQNPPDAILFDLSTYGMTFFSFLKQLRAQPETQDMPVILLALSMTWFDFEMPQELRVTGVINDNPSADIAKKIAALLNWDC
ncbi:MAG: response regulator [Snowella sp.]|nr:response regulator [Snowella sp.]